MRSVRLLGIGTDAIDYVATDDGGRIDIGKLEEALRKRCGNPQILWLQAGDLNTGVFDHFARACPLAHAANAWVHVDGAFGLWAATSKRHCHLLDGVEQADSWATDGHKWLNVPFDSGLVFVAHPSAHRAAFAQDTSYSVPREKLRNQKDWNPEWSRRARGFPVYAAIRALGRSGIGEIVDRCCACAERLIAGIGELPGAEIVAAPTINQGLVRFLADDGNHDRATDEVIGKHTGRRCRLVRRRDVARHAGHARIGLQLGDGRARHRAQLGVRARCAFTLCPCVGAPRDECERGTGAGQPFLTTLALMMFRPRQRAKQIPKS